MKSFLLLLLAALLLFGCEKVENPVYEGVLTDSISTTEISNITYYTIDHVRYLITGTSKEVYLYYYSNDAGHFSPHQILPFEKEFVAFKYKYYYVNVTNLNDSGEVNVKLFINDSLITSKSMSGQDGNIRIEGHF